MRATVTLPEYGVADLRRPQDDAVAADRFDDAKSGDTDLILPVDAQNWVLSFVALVPGRLRERRGSDMAAQFDGRGAG